MPLLSYLREKFPWFPTIDPDACRADLQCLNFCPHDVFEWDPKPAGPWWPTRYAAFPAAKSASKVALPGHFPAHQARVSGHVEKAARNGKQAASFNWFISTLRISRRQMHVELPHRNSSASTN